MTTQTPRPRRSFSKLATLCVLLLSLALAAGCKGGNDDPSGARGAAPPVDSTGSPGAEASLLEEQAREVAESVLLTLRDFPAGWSQLPPDDDVEDPPLNLPPECQAFAEMEEWPGTLVDTDSPEFEGPDDEEVQSGVTVYVDAEAAHQAWANGKAAIDLCREPMRAALAAYLQEILRAQYPEAIIDVVDFTWDWLPFPSFGEESAAMRMSFTVNGGPQPLVFHSDFIDWRVGRIEASLAFDSRTVAPDTKEEERLAKLLDERLKNAAGDLD